LSTTSATFEIVKLILVRHGATEWSVSGRHTGNTDLALTELGRQQVDDARERVVAAIGDLQFALWSSPLQRARQTTEILFGEYSCTVDERLREFDYGDTEGLTTLEMRELIPGWTVWEGCAGGETVADVSHRVDSFLEHLHTSDGDTNVIVAHAHLLRILAARALGQPGEFGRHLTLDTASVSVIADYRDGASIVRWNVAESTSAP
jgi:probable phosphoglycerate mutase